MSALHFAGQYTDAETGFQYLRARYYDPATGQFLSRDPLAAITGSPYGYTGGDPLNGTDPAGLWGWNPISDVAQAWNDTGGKAVTFVNDQTQTVGVCGQQSIGVIIYVSFQACVAVDRHLDVAVMGSGDAGVGSPTISAGGGPMFSSARHVRDLNGSYAIAGGSIGEGVTGGLDVARSSDCTGKSLTTFYPTVGFGFEGLPGFEGHWGIGQTGMLASGPTSCPSKPGC